MGNRVCIVGIGLVESHEALGNLNHRELLFYATRRALDDAGLERDDIGGAVTASYDFLEGRSLSNQYTLDSMGGVMKSCDTRLGDEGIISLFAGCVEVMAEPSRILVVGSVNGSELDPQELGYQTLIAEAMEPLFSKPVCKAVPNLLGLESVLAAMEAKVYLQRSGVTEEQLAKVAVKNLNNANYGKGKSAYDVTDVLKSELLSWPLRKMAMAKQTTAACTLVLASEKKAKTLAKVKAPVFIRGIGWCSDKGHFPLRQPGLARETEWAAHRAYDMAGIQHPDKEIDLAEVSDWYAYRELMHCEALGFCRPDEIGSCISDGKFEKDGQLPVNVSGGLIGRGNAIVTSGLIRVAQVAQQIRGQANGYRVPDVEVGLAHAWAGIPWATAGVAILSKW